MIIFLVAPWLTFQGEQDWPLFQLWGFQFYQPNPTPPQLLMLPLDNNWTTYEAKNAQWMWQKSMTRSAMYPVNHLGEPCKQAHATLDGWHWVFKLFHKALNLILYQNLFDSAVTRFTAAQTKLSGRAGAIVKSGGGGSDWIYSPAIFQNCWNLSAVLEARWHQPGAQVDTSELLSPRPSRPGWTLVYLSIVHFTDIFLTTDEVFVRQFTNITLVYLSARTWWYQGLALTKQPRSASRVASN